MQRFLSNRTESKRKQLLNMSVTDELSMQRTEESTSHVKLLLLLLVKTLYSEGVKGSGSRGLVCDRRCGDACVEILQHD